MNDNDRPSPNHRRHPAPGSLGMEPGDGAKEPGSPPLVHDQVAQLYDKARPHYPAALFDDIIAYAQLQDKARILEIGCGTGQATGPLAQRGYRIDCVEPGERMAAIASANLSAFPNVAVACTDFETYSPPSASYDLILSATAFHWLDPRIRFRKAYDLLKSGGALALFWHRPTQTETSRNIIRALQTIYRELAPELTDGYDAPPSPELVATEYEELIPGNGYFTDLEIRKRFVGTEYSARAYVDLLKTFSDHQKLEPRRRRQLLSAIERLINSRFAGTIIRETVALLYLARRV